uniref:Uncharacterized protein n=1 Tax=Oryza sativa subsp. japonica TaxID=39947 RepID=Q7Y153_ORYSJ|nr:hypothetical protein [Oryza sativa Japonica Group]
MVRGQPGGVRQIAIAALSRFVTDESFPGSVHLRAQVYGMSRCLRNSVRLRTCMGRRAIKFLGNASSATALVLHGYCCCIDAFTKMSTEIGDKMMNDINGGNPASKSSGGMFSGCPFLVQLDRLIGAKQKQKQGTNEMLPYHALGD